MADAFWRHHRHFHGIDHPQPYCKTLLPFLKPALISALVIAFLLSFENDDNTTFTILAEKTLVTVLAGEVRQGTTPALSALAVIIISLSLLGAIIYEVMKRCEESAAERAKENAKIAERSDLADAAAGL